MLIKGSEIRKLIREELKRHLLQEGTKGVDDPWVASSDTDIAALEGSPSINQTLLHPEKDPYLIVFDKFDDDINELPENAKNIKRIVKMLNKLSTTKRSGLSLSAQLKDVTDQPSMEALKDALVALQGVKGGPKLFTAKNSFASANEKVPAPAGGGANEEIVAIGDGAGGFTWEVADKNLNFFDKSAYRALKGYYEKIFSNETIKKLQVLIGETPATGYWTPKTDTQLSVYFDSKIADRIKLEGTTLAAIIEKGWKSQAPLIRSVAGVPTDYKGNLEDLIKFVTMLDNAETTAGVAAASVEKDSKNRKPFTSGYTGRIR